MSQIKTTGYVRVQNGQQTQLDLTNFTKVLSARVRWKGVTVTDTRTSTDSKSDTGITGLAVGTNIPTVPSGWTFLSIKLQTFVMNLSGDIIPKLYAQTRGPYATDTLRVDAANNITITNVQESSNANDIGTHVTHYAATEDADGNVTYKNCRLSGFAETTYTKTDSTADPKATVNGQSCQLFGCLNDGVVSPWFTLNSLVTGQINIINHSIGSLGLVDIEIEYTVEAPAVIKTNDPTNVSYSTVTMNAEVTATNGENPTRYFEYGTTPTYGTIINKGVAGVGVFSHNLTGLLMDILYYYRAYGVNSEGAGYGAQKTFKTLYPYLAAPVRNSPDDGLRTAERQPWIEITLPANPDNPATKYHARIRFSEYVDMSNSVSCESINNPECWQLWNGSQWISFPITGVDPGVRVRGKPASDLPLTSLYWDAASSDDTKYGANTTSRSIRILLTVNGLYSLFINNVEYLAYEVTVSETANGQIGEIAFSIKNADGANNTAIHYGDEVQLGVNDAFGNTDEFKGIVRSKTPQNYTLAVRAITGSGIMAERRIKVDYASQDIGLTVKAIIDTYCQPLTSTNINTSTGIVAPIIAKDQTPLKVLEDIRRKYGITYFIDKDWDTHFYLPSAIGQAYITVLNGGEVGG